MANKIGGVYIETAYKIDMNSFKQVQNSVANISKQTSALSTGFKALGKVAVAAFSVKAIMDFGKQSVKLASDLAEVQNVVDVTFGNLASDINNFAKSSIKDFGLSETAAKQYSSTIGAIAKSMGFTTEDALVMGKSMTALAADMASFYNLDADEAFNKIRSGLTGETEPLKQLGINMSVANLQAYALSQGITKQVNAMSEQEKMLLRNNYLLSVTADAQGDFARNSNSWANQTRILSEQFNTLKATLGSIGIKFILPIIQGFNALFSTIQSSTNALANFLGIATNSDVSITSSAGLGAEAVGGIADSYEEVGKAAKKAKGQVAGFDNVIQLSQPETGGGDSSGGTVSGSNLGVGLASYDFSPKEEEQGKAFGFIDKLKEKLQTLPDSIKSVSSSLSDIGQGIKPSALNFLDSFKEYLITTGGNLLSVGKGAFEGVLGGIDLYFKQNKTRLSTSWSGIFDNLSVGAGNVTGILTTTSELLTNFFKLETTKQAIADALAIVESYISNTRLLLTGLWADLTGSVNTILEDNKVKFDELLTGFSELISTNMGTIKEIVDNTFASIFEMYDTYIKPFIDNFTEGLSGIVDKILEAYNEHILPTWQAISEEFNLLYTNTIKPFIDKLMTVVGKIVELVGIIWKNFVAPIIGFLVDILAPIWSAVFKTIWNVVKTTIETVIGIVSGIIDAFIGVIDFITGVFTGDWGKALEGIKELFKGVFNTIGKIMLAPLNVFIDLWNKVVDMIGVVKIPDWVPFIGGLEFTLPKIPKPDLSLADGGIVTSRTWTEIGEAGPEAVIPLKNDTYTDALAQNVANRVGKNSGNGREVIIKFENNNIFGSDLDTIAQLVKKSLDKEDIRVGGVVYDF